MAEIEQALEEAPSECIAVHSGERGRRVDDRSALRFLRGASSLAAEGSRLPRESAEPRSLAGRASQHLARTRRAGAARRRRPSSSATRPRARGAAVRSRTPSTLWRWPRRACCPSRRRARSTATSRRAAASNRRLDVPSRETVGPPQARDEASFKARFEELTAGTFRNWSASDWENVVVAGGAVVACLSCEANTSPNTDVDVFLYGMDDAAARAKIERIFDKLKSESKDALALRTPHTVTVVLPYPKRIVPNLCDDQSGAPRQKRGRLPRRSRSCSTSTPRPPRSSTRSTWTSAARTGTAPKPTRHAAARVRSRRASMSLCRRAGARRTRRASSNTRVAALAWPSRLDVGEGARHRTTSSSI